MSVVESYSVIIKNLVTRFCSVQHRIHRETHRIELLGFIVERQVSLVESSSVIIKKLVTRFFSVQHLIHSETHRIELLGFIVERRMCQWSRSLA